MSCGTEPISGAPGGGAADSEPPGTGPASGSCGGCGGRTLGEEDGTAQGRQHYEHRHRASHVQTGRSGTFRRSAITALAMLTECSEEKRD